MNHKLAIYLDMDGCLCDFDKKASSIFPDFREVGDMWKRNDKSSRRYKDLNSKLINQIKACPDFWSDMDWMNNGMSLWNQVKLRVPTENIHILTAPIWQDKERCKKQKHTWCQNNLDGFNMKNFICDHQKYNYVEWHDTAHHHILIDDKPSNIEKWKDQGGLGILHHDDYYAHTILQLISINNMTFTETR